ncbi:type IV pilus biogenesis protein PilM [Thermodesulfobacteriota bacterium]
MIFGKKTQLVGLDIGSQTIKVAQIIDTKKGTILKSFGVTNIAPGAIEEGVIKDPDSVAESIRQLFKENNIKELNVAISIGGYSVIVKKINVATMEEEQLQDTINLEAEQYIPFDISDVSLDFQILGESENNPNQMSVLLVAAKKEMIDDYVSLANLAGLNPIVLDVDAFALQNIYEINYEAGDENIALIDIGASKTSLNIIKEEASVFMRDVSLGCGQINERIMSLAGCSYEEAEQMKLSAEPENISPEDLDEIMTSVMSSWTAEIRRALDFFYSTYPDDHIEKIVLSGGGGNIQEFSQLLAEETQAEVETINPFTNFEMDPNQFQSSFIERIAPQAAICMGLAIRKVDDK